MNVWTRIRNLAVFGIGMTVVSLSFAFLILIAGLVMLPAYLGATNPTPTYWDISDRDVVVIFPGAQDGETIRILSTDLIMIRLRWYASSEVIVENNLDNMRYFINLDGRTVDDINNYHSWPLRSSRDIVIDGEVTDAWFIQWDYPIDGLPPGRHILKVGYHITGDLTDGWNTYREGELTIWEITVVSRAP